MDFTPLIRAAWINPKVWIRELGYDEEYDNDISDDDELFRITRRRRKRVRLDYNALALSRCARVTSMVWFLAVGEMSSAELRRAAAAYCRRRGVNEDNERRLIDVWLPKELIQMVNEFLRSWADGTYARL